MGWETRGNGQYYYHKRREGRRVVSEYVSRQYASLFASLDEEAKTEREQKRRAERKEREAIQIISGATNQMDELVSALVSLSLMNEGYHQHKGQWRKKRHGRQSDHQE